MARDFWGEHSFFVLLFAGYALFGTSLELFLAVEALAGFLLLATLLRKKSIRLNPIALVTLLFAVYLPVNFLSMLRFEHTIGDFTTVAIQFVLITLLVVYVSQFERIRPNVLLRLWAMVGVAIAAVTFVQYAGFLFLGVEATFTSGPLPRATGIFGEPSNLGHFLIPPFAIILVSTLRDEYIFSTRYRQYMALGAIALATLLTLSQGALVVLFSVFALVILGPVTDFAKTVRMVGGGAGIVVVLAMTPPGYLMIQSFFFRMVEAVAFVVGVDGPKVAFNSSIETRIGDGLLNLKIWADHPLFGVGANQIQHHFTNYQITFGTNPQSIYGIPMTGYLADYGAVGFAIIVCIYVICFRSALAGWEPPTPLWAPALVYVLVSRLFAQLLTGSIVHPGLWMAIAVLIACRYGRSDAPQFITLSTDSRSARDSQRKYSTHPE